MHVDNPRTDHRPHRSNVSLSTTATHRICGNGLSKLGSQPSSMTNGTDEGSASLAYKTMEA
jgi:hypothetical protein